MAEGSECPEKKKSSAESGRPCAAGRRLAYRWGCRGRLVEMVRSEQRAQGAEVVSTG